MSTLTDILPGVTPVEVGGVLRAASQLRIKDIALFQSILETRTSHPYDLLRDDILAAQGEDRERLILLARRESASWPPLFGPGTPMDFRFLCAWLSCVLRHDPEALDAVEEIALSMKPQELDALERVAYHDTPRDRLSRLLSQGGVNASAPRDTWGEKIDQVAVSHHLTYEQVGDLTISQFYMARSGGRATPLPSPSLSGLTHEELCERLRRERRLLGIEEGT